MNTVPAEIRDPETYAVIGAAMEIYNQLGRGFLENVYQEAMLVELETRGIASRCQVDIPIYYKGRLLPCNYRADFVCYGGIIVELKATKSLTDVERAQVLNYLKATGFKRALLINFGAGSLEFERFAN